jgi:hypothetical protein
MATLKETGKAATLTPGGPTCKLVSKAIVILSLYSTQASKYYDKKLIQNLLQ